MYIHGSGLNLNLMGIPKNQNNPRMGDLLNNSFWCILTLTYGPPKPCSRYEGELNFNQLCGLHGLAFGKIVRNRLVHH